MILGWWVSYRNDINYLYTGLKLKDIIVFKIVPLKIKQQHLNIIFLIVNIKYNMHPEVNPYLVINNKYVSSS